MRRAGPPTQTQPSSHSIDTSQDRSTGEIGSGGESRQVSASSGPACTIAYGQSAYILTVLAVGKTTSWVPVSR